MPTVLRGCFRRLGLRIEATTLYGLAGTVVVFVTVATACGTESTNLQAIDDGGVPNPPLVQYDTLNESTETSEPGTSATLGSGCDLLAMGSLLVDRSAVPYSDRVTGSLAETPILDRQSAAGGQDRSDGELGDGLATAIQRVDPSGALGELSLQTDFTEGQEEFAYFSDRELTRSATYTSFLTNGGLLATRVKSPHDGGLAATLLDDRSPDRNETLREVNVGEHRAVLNLADPLESGTRPYLISWLDEGFDITLTYAAEDPAAIVNIARAFACEARDR